MSSHNRLSDLHSPLLCHSALLFRSGTVRIPVRANIVYRSTRTYIVYRNELLTLTYARAASGVLLS